MKRCSKQPNTGPAKRPKAGRGVLWVVALLLAGSGIVRLGGPVGHAVASEVLALNESHKEVSIAGGTAAGEAEIALVLAQLRDREAQLALREVAVEERLEALALAESEIKLNMTALVEAEQALAATMSLANSAAEDDLERLTAVYENMKPKDAAPLFEEMDPQFAAGFLGRMRADAAASIMSGLEPQTAYTISVILAGRNADVPTN